MKLYRCDYYQNRWNLTSFDTDNYFVIRIKTSYFDGFSGTDSEKNAMRFATRKDAQAWVFQRGLKDATIQDVSNQLTRLGDYWDVTLAIFFVIGGVIGFSLTQFLLKG